LDIGFIRAAEIAIQLCLPECNYSEPASPNMKVPSVSSRGLALVGSAVLSAGVADDLCARFPNQSHRWLSEERSRMLSRRHLAAASAELGYAPEGDFNDGRYRASASDALEVVLGDQYFRWGWEEARSTSMRIVRLTTPEC
jgi:hypothetical protein